MKLYPPKRPTALIGRCWMPQPRPSSLNVGRKKRETVATEGRPTIINHCKTQVIRPLRDRETLLDLLVSPKIAPLDPFRPLPARGCGPFPLVFKKIAHPAATPPALTFCNSLPASKKCGGSRPRMLRRSNRKKQLPNYRRTARASGRRLTPRRLCTHPWLLCWASTASTSRSPL
jgi:hypothetical protein